MAGAAGALLDRPIAWKNAASIGNPGRKPGPNMKSRNANTDKLAAGGLVLSPFNPPPLKTKTIMKTKFTLIAIVGFAAVGSALAADKPIHPEADRLLRETSARIAAANSSGILSVSRTVAQNLVIGFMISRLFSS
jgi:hypothetical protein